MIIILVYYYDGSNNSLLFIPTCRIPETKGLSLEQVDLLYTNSTVLKSNSYRLQLIANNLHEGMTPAEKAYQEKLEHI
jgi:hypothetical protein